MLRINFIGCGQLGTTLAFLWQQQPLLNIGDVLTQSFQSAETAVQRIGGGRAIHSIKTMQAANLYMIACHDDAIASCSQTLAESQLIARGDIVFHCSGAQSSDLLHACQEQGAHTASIHPIKSFADITLAAESFAGTFCGVEGDDTAISTLEPLFTGLGAEFIPIVASQKTLYHAASVIACNYLVTLQELSIQAFQQSGIERQQAMNILKPIVTGTVDNVFRLGTSEALTGPIARGDQAIVADQLAAITSWESQIGELYRLLGQFSLPLARQQGHANAAQLDHIQALLKTKIG